MDKILSDIEKMGEAVSDSLLACILNSSTDAIIGKDTSATIFRWSRGAEQLSGYSAKEAVGKNLSFLFPPDKWEAFQELIEEAKVSGLIENLETSWVRKDGITRRMLMNIAAISGEAAGEIRGFTIIAQDITERIEAQEAISTSELRYRRIFESAKDGILLLDADKGTVYDVNPALMEMLGYSRDDMVGNMLWDIGPLKNIEQAKKTFKELLKKEQAHYENLPLETKDGRIIEVEVLSSVYMVNQARVVQCNFRDISERNELAEALNISELRYRRLFESSKDGILLLDADKGTVYDVNPSLMEMLGYSHEDMVGKVLWEIGPIKNIQKAKDAFKELLKKEQAHYENLPLETSDERIVEVEVLSSVYKVKQTRVVQCNFRDITERNALKEQKADFYAMVTHDIRSPLTSVLGYSELLMSRADKFDAETNQMVAAIMKSGERIDTLIENFLSISIVEAGKLVLNLSPTNITALLRDASSEIKMAVQEKQLDLKIAITDGLPEAMVDSRLIQRALLNLLHNAINYTPAPGTITLKAVFDGNFIIISITDTGMGIPAHEQKAIFTKYFRSKKTSGVKGSGLGLAIVKSAVEAHGGRVEVESEVGQGSTFRLIIPAAVQMKKVA